MITFAEIIDSLKRSIVRNTPLAGEGCHVEQGESGRIIHIDPPPLPPPFIPVKITSGPDANGWYKGDAYENGTTLPKTRSDIYIWVWGMKISSTSSPQGFWLSRLSGVIIGGQMVQVHEVFPNIPIVPSSLKNYFLMSLKGVVQWVEASECK